MKPFSSREELNEWISREVVFTSEVMELMNCSRQNLHKYVKSGRLVPIKDTGKERLFLRSDVESLKESVSSYNRKPKTDKPGE
ncbi:Helix-turn-helix domain protein [compost metagenome]